MRIMIVQRVLPEYRLPFFNGLAEHLAISDSSLTLLAGSPDPAEAIVEAKPAESLAEILRVPNIRVPGPMWWQRGVSAAVRRTGSEIVVLEANPRLLSNVSVLSFCRATGVSPVLWGIGRIERSRRFGMDSLSRRVLQLQLSLSKAAIGYGSGAADTFRSLGRHGLAVSIAPNATLATASANDSPTVWPTEWTYLFVGRLVAQKRVDVLLDAAVALNRLGLRFRVAIVGEGPEEERLRSQAAEIVNVEFLGRLSPDEVAKAMRLAHALVLPGRGGLVAQEALTHGLPLVLGPPHVAGDGTIHRLVQDSGASVVADGTDALAFCEAMRRLALDGNWAKRCELAKKAALEHGGLGKMISEFARTLECM